jgi:hypothetical protein
MEQRKGKYEKKTKKIGKKIEYKWKGKRRRNLKKKRGNYLRMWRKNGKRK